jgi:hypothetical protein
MPHFENIRYADAGDDAGLPLATVPVVDAVKTVIGSLADVGTGYHVWIEGAPW